MINKPEYVNRAKKNIAGLRDIKQKIKAQLPPLEVDISTSNNLQLQNAMTAIFGDSVEDRSKITLDMYINCMKIIRMAGQAKGANMINRRQF